MAVLRPRDDLELRRLLRRAALYPALLMVLVAGALAWQVVNLRRLGEWVDHTDVVIARVDTIARLEVENESALRGFLLTGERSVLEAYREAERQVGPALAALERLVADNPEQAARARRLRELTGAWQARAAEALRLRQEGGDHGGTELVLARTALMDEVRAETRRAVEVEERLRVERSARARRASQVVLVSAVALSLLLGLVLALLARAQQRRVAAVYQRTALAAERRAAELAESDERFRLFVEGVRDAAIFMLDPEGRVRSWNAGAERIEGYRPEQIVGQHFSLFYTPEDAEAGLPGQELREAEAKGQADSEGWRVRRDGSRFWAAVTVRPLRSAGGRLVGYAKLVRDTTERKRVEMRRAAEYGVALALTGAASPAETLPRLLEAVTPALGYDLGLAWVPEGGALRLAASWLRPSARAEAFLATLAGLRLGPGEGLPGRVWASATTTFVEDVRRELGYPRAPQAMEAGLLTALAFPVPVEGEVGLVVQLLASDPRPSDADQLQTASTLGTQIGAYLAKQRAEQVAREAERRRAEELERRVQERTVALTAVNRELEAFSYSVSHDLRAPLRAMDGFSQVLLEDYPAGLDARGRDYLGRIRAASQRMSQLIDDLIQLSRVTRSELKREPIDLSSLFREVAAEVQEREPARRMALAVEEGVQARGDARLLRAGLANLVGNAFKFTRQQPSPRLEFGVSEGADGRVYHVRDNGAGFDMAYAAKLFQPFQRLHASTEFEGTGIGLATWQRIVQRHGGRAWAEAAPGRGATFYFTLGEH